MHIAFLVLSFFLLFNNGDDGRIGVNDRRALTGRVGERLIEGLCGLSGALDSGALGGFGGIVGLCVGEICHQGRTLSFPVCATPARNRDPAIIENCSRDAEAEKGTTKRRKLDGGDYAKGCS